MSKNYLYIVAAFTVVAVALVAWIGIPGRQLPPAAQSGTVELKDGDMYTLTADYVTKRIAGSEQKMLAYNGSIPGPTIRVPQGAKVTINFKNSTDLPALLHSHGVRMGNAFDGSQAVQREMKPGETFAYELTFPDAGIYWYHPHAKEAYEQPLGLYGAFIVTPSDAAYFPPANREVPLFLSDLPVENGNIALVKNRTSHSLMGRYGNVMLVNGEEDFVLSAGVGDVVRLYVVNAANARPFNFAIEGLRLKLVGGDSGAYERASFADSVTLGPSERAIVDVLIPRAGTYRIVNRTPGVTRRLGAVSAGGERAGASYAPAFETLQSNALVTASIEPFRSSFSRTPDKRIALTLDMAGGMMSAPGVGQGMHMMPDGTVMGGSVMHKTPGGIEWEDDMAMMNAASDADSVQWRIVDQDTGKKNMAIDWAFKRGEPVKIRIYNDPDSMHPMQHPIHFHGQRFLVVERDGVQQVNLVWKDTVLVKTGEIVDIILDTSNPGVWMAHCHIAEHLEAGMMMQFRVD